VTSPTASESSCATFAAKPWCRTLYCLAGYPNPFRASGLEVRCHLFAHTSATGYVSVFREIESRSHAEQLGPLPNGNDREQHLHSQSSGDHWRPTKRHQTQLVRLCSPVPFSDLIFHSIGIGGVEVRCERARDATRLQSRPHRMCGWQVHDHERNTIDS
jgi:hypothetical protein